MRIAVLMACHDRRVATLAGLDALAAQTGLPSGVQLTVFLLDDGSRDGTGAAVRAAYPAVRVLEGDGTCYWAGGMRRAWDQARAEGADVYFWLNDDTRLDPGALAAFLACHFQLALQGCSGILVGSTRDPVTGRLTYGGLGPRRPLGGFDLERVVPGRDPVPCATFNGNSVWVPAEVVDRIGGLSAAFTHGCADFDYGFRARKRGVRCWVLPGTVGTCARNPDGRPWLRPGLSLGQRWRAIQGAKALPFLEWGVFCCRHGGVLGPALWLAPYLKMLVRHGLLAGRGPAR